MSSRHADLTAEITAKRLTVQQAISRIANERDANLAEFMIPCDACGTLVDIQHSWSAVFWLAFGGHPTCGGFQLNETIPTGGTGQNPDQHFCCSEACLEQATIRCFRENYAPEAHRRRQVHE